MEETAQTISAIRAGDMIMANMAAKGLPGSKMKTIVNALESAFPARPRSTKPRHRAD
jgi:hypothetical protein